MLGTWGGDNGLDTISQKELYAVGFDTCENYCKEYCWYHGMGHCENCAYDEERNRRRKEEGSGE